MFPTRVVSHKSVPQERLLQECLPEFSTTVSNNGSPFVFECVCEFGLVVPLCLF